MHFHARVVCMDSTRFLNFYGTATESDGAPGADTIKHVGRPLPAIARIELRATVRQA